MTRSSPPRRSQLLSSPERNIAASFLLDSRNNELNHRDALAAAQVEHERVRQAAIRVYELHELQQEHRRIVEEERKEEERLRAEALVVAEEKRLRELRAKTIPKLPPEPQPPAPPPAKSEPQKIANGTTPARESKQPEPPRAPAPEIKQPGPSAAPAAASSSPNPFAAQNKPTLSSPFAPTAPGQPSTQSPFQKSNGFATTQPAAPTTAQPLAKPAAPVTQSAPTVDRYSQIHQELKKLRKELQAQSKVAGSPLKGKLGTFRREIRVSIGQLTGGKGANAQPINKITATLKEAIDGRTPSPPIDVSLFVVDKREPVEGVPNNDATLPSLFIYLINICAKAIINQFINEGSANPKAADPVGVFAAHIFSNKDFSWRGQSLIDILMAKYRIVCPVLFGHRGNDRTERGRIAIGWKKEGPAWITEQNHNDRMTGLGAGFASLSLRDFSKSSKKNPYPPTNYWKALAYIVNTPPNETSNTQYVVLRSMIQGHEHRFLKFYGNAALAALRLALVEFPKKAPQNATAAGSLSALVDVLKSESGLILA
ncbi:RNA export mediator GLE1 [Fusarium albosuccineum]|uniref:mRNA export factor GLE1 n=1 Tax=Fusarium albosuccineum TaxID=1237068 RepID=A0A8H4KZ71_9HYPO|nr:RNA export mediator GLE1 [Fusarium albosuccineum]